MTSWQPLHETRLADLLRQTLVDYGHAMRVMDEIDSLLRKGADASTPLQRLQAVTRQIASREANPAYQQLIELWKEHQPTAASGDVPRLIRQQQAMLEQLIPRVESIHAAALEQQSQLSPELDLRRRSQQVVSAYAAAVRNA